MYFNYRPQIATCTVDQPLGQDNGDSVDYLTAKVCIALSICLSWTGRCKLLLHVYIVGPLNKGHFTMEGFLSPSVLAALLLLLSVFTEAR